MDAKGRTDIMIFYIAVLVAHIMIGYVLGSSQRLFANPLEQAEKASPTAIPVTTIVNWLLMPSAGLLAGRNTMLLKRLQRIKSDKETAPEFGQLRIAFLSYILLDNAMGKRSSPDIIATILEAANGGIGKTRLLTKANLTSAQFKKYIDLLVKKKLITELEEPNERPAYKTTGLGLQYLALYNSIKAISYLKA